jgi:NADH:ubiquinone oxidoreductase subunit K
MIHGPQILALFLIALVAACAIGMGIVFVRDRRAGR